MKHYAIGDLQGCLNPLLELLDKIHYHPDTHILWFTGDLVNRGPDSLATLRFIKQLPSHTVCVLGNHDFSLLASGYINRPLKHQDTFQDILEAPDKEELLAWIRQMPLLHYDKKLNYVMTHAGIYPGWSIAQAQMLAQEVATWLKGEQYRSLLIDLYTASPLKWSDELAGLERIKFIVNAFTRMRFCTPSGEMHFGHSGEKAPLPLLPWFKISNPYLHNEKIIFGHWASLKGYCEIPSMHALDTGCVWGECLTALCLETQERTNVKCERLTPAMD